MSKVIYQPKGAAAEYCPDGYALNLYDGCSHQCTYCFAPSVLYKTREQFHSNPQPRKDIIERVKKEVADHKGDKVFLCFTTDPYQPIEEEHRITRKVLELFLENDITPVILTKGLVPKEDWALFIQFKELYFGTTLTHSHSWKTNEKGALDSFMRIAQLERAHSLGLNTWISLEPVLNSENAYEIVKETFMFCDHYKVGKWNYDKRANEIDWTKFVKEIKQIFDVLGCNYYIKESLKKYE